MRYFAVLLTGLLSSLAGVAQQPEQHTIKSNIQYRLSRGDLPELTFGVERPKNVEVISGGEALLQKCLNDSVTWSQDPLLFRLAHTHAGSIQSCRENSSPSMHAIFRRVADEPLQTWVHLDGHGAQTSGTRMVHLGEVLYHRITFQDNDQDRMFADLERSFANPLVLRPSPVVPLTGKARFKLFTNKTLTQVQPYASSVVSSATLMLFSPSRLWGRGTDLFTNHLVGSFARRLVTYGVQSAAAAALHEDLRYKPSLSGNFWKRSEHALFSTLVLETARGNDIAYANVIAAITSGVVINLAHPGQENFTRPGAWRLAGMNMVGFAEGNLWNEFKPDLKHLVRSKILHKQ